jgi:cytochrome c-type biogenesis protein
MALELSALPLAVVSGMLSVLSPCVWPLVPIVLGSAASSGIRGMLLLSLGLSISFAIAGSLLSFILVSLNLDPELFRYLSASLLILVALPLISEQLSEQLNLLLSKLRLPSGANGNGGPLGQFGIGLLLGLVWLPCVGPTLGAAIALASMGQSLAFAFVVMLAYGLGTALVLIAAALAIRAGGSAFLKNRSHSVGRAKSLLGFLLLGLGVAVLLGLDKIAERWANSWLPDIVTSI